MTPSPDPESPGDAFLLPRHEPRRSAPGPVEVCFFQQKKKEEEEEESWVPLASEALFLVPASCVGRTRRWSLRTRPPSIATGLRGCSLCDSCHIFLRRPSPSRCARCCSSFRSRSREPLCVLVSARHVRVTAALAGVAASRCGERGRA